MLRIDTEYDKEFEDIYNKFNMTPNGKRYLELSGISRNKLDVSSMSKQYFNDNVSDVSVDPNSNVGQSRSFNSYTSEVTKGLLKLNGYYLMWKYLKRLYSDGVAEELLSDSIKGLYYPHDLTKWQIPYCIAISTSNLMVEGRPYGHLHSLPAKRSDSYISQVIETVMDLSQEMAGAIAVADMIVNYTWYINNEIDGDVLDSIKNDLVLRKKIYNDFQRFIHVVNNKFRLGGDSPFSNISLYDRKTLRSVFEKYNFPDGKNCLDLTEEIIEVEKIFMELVAKKDPDTGLPYRFPVCTINLFVDEETNTPFDTEFVELVSEYNREGIFNIFITSDTAKIASCCRLVNNIKDLLKYKGADSFGNGGLNIGSHRVCTINLPRLARKTRNVQDFLAMLKDKMDGAARILMAHRVQVKDNIDKGFLKFFKPLQWLDLDRMFYSTIGINGLFEAMNYLNIDTIEQVNTVAEVLDSITHMSYDLTACYGVPINIEQTPAEGAAINLAKKDLVYFGTNDYLLYSNQFVPLWENVDIPTRARIDGKLSKYFSGGSICHLNIGSKASKEQMKNLINFSIENGLEHFALNPQYSVCENGHIILCNNSVKTCPICGLEFKEHYTRVVGYFTPISNWTSVRKGNDFPRRKYNYLD